MRWTTKNIGIWMLAFVLIAGALSGCGKKSAPQDLSLTDAVPFKPYAIEDSSKIITYPDGLKIYVVKQGAGDFPINGTPVRMHYYGLLDDGTVFDETFSHGEPFEFSLGSGSVIKGMEEAVKKLRLGSQAIVMIPPSLGYGDGAGKLKKELPPKIPANARLTFHLEVVGTF